MQKGKGGKNEQKEKQRGRRALTQMEEQPNLIAGRNAVLELLQSERAVDKLWVKRGEREGSIRKIVAQALARHIPVVEAEGTKLDALCPTVKHQGVVALAAEKPYATVDDLFAIAKERAQDPFFVIADSVNDPHNLGALMRCAEGAGAHGLIIPKRHGVSLTATVAKSSAGAVHHLAVARVSNLHTTILELKKKGVWIYAAEADGTPYDACDLKGPAAFLFGSEGEGVSHLLRQSADFVVSLPMYGKVNSLNVSAAGAIILYEAARQRHTKK